MPPLALARDDPEIGEAIPRATHRVFESYRQVPSTQPVASYVGGKRQLARRVTAAINALPHQTYCEALVGMGAGFLRRTRAPRTEVNDLSQDIADPFHILRRRHQAFMDMLKWQVTSRAEFDRLMRQAPATLTDLKRAAAPCTFLYLQRLSSGGSVSPHRFGIDTKASAHFEITKFSSVLEEMHARLAGVWIKCLPQATFLVAMGSADRAFLPRSALLGLGAHLRVRAVPNGGSRAPR